jgi:hypothetical protein
MDTGQFNGTSISSTTSHAESMGRRRRWCETSKQWKDNIWESRCEGFGGSGIAPNTDSDWCRQEHKLCTRGNLPEEWTDESRTPPDTDSTRVSRQSINARTSKEIRQRRKSFEKIGDNGFIGGWNNFPTVSPVFNGDDGLSDRLDSITFSKWRTESIKGGGNAVVPQVVYQIFKTIEQYELSQQPPASVG